jgi:hypothetical protein
LMRQHHTMASIMQSRLTNMQVQPWINPFSSLAFNLHRL